MFDKSAIIVSAIKVKLVNLLSNNLINQSTN